MKIFSHVAVEAVGLNQNQLFQLVCKQNVALFNVVRISKDRSRFVLSKKDFEKLKSEGVFARYQLKVWEKPSAAYYFYYFPKRIGLFAAALLMILCAVFCSQTLFVVEINAANALQTQQIKEYLKKNNIKMGRRWADISTKKIESDLFDCTDSASNIVVRRQGTRLVVEMQQTQQSAVVEGPIVAPRTGTIEKIVVAKGTATKKEGELVVAGEKIVLPDQNGQSQAKIALRTYNQSSVAVSRFLIQKVRSGKKIAKSQLVWPFCKPKLPSKTVKYNQYEVVVKTEECLGFLLPLKKYTVEFFELVDQKVDQNQAIELAKQKALELATNGQQPNKMFFEIRQQNGEVFVDCFAEFVVDLF